MTSPPTVVASVSHSLPSRAEASCDSHVAGQADSSVGKRLRYGFALLELVADVADELGEHVFKGQNAGGAAELVHDQRLVRMALAKLAEHAVGRDALVDACDRTHQRLDARPGGISPAGHQPSHDVLGVQDADDVVNRVAVDRQARVRALDERGQ